MPTMYLPAVREHTVVVIPDPAAPYGNRFNIIEWDEKIPRRRQALAGKAETLIDLWERDLVRLGDRRAQWRFEHESHDGALVSKAIAVPRHLSRSERIDMLLSRIFVLSCFAQERGNHARVQYLDDLYDRIDDTEYPPSGR
jgi:hypothetical protein